MRAADGSAAAARSSEQGAASSHGTGRTWPALTRCCVWDAILDPATARCPRPVSCWTWAGWPSGGVTADCATPKTSSDAARPVAQFGGTAPAPQDTQATKIPGSPSGVGGASRAEGHEAAQPGPFDQRGLGRQAVRRVRAARTGNGGRCLPRRDEEIAASANGSSARTEGVRIKPLRAALLLTSVGAARARPKLWRPATRGGFTGDAGAVGTHLAGAWFQDPARRDARTLRPAPGRPTDVRTCSSMGGSGPSTGDVDNTIGMDRGRGPTGSPGTLDAPACGVGTLGQKVGTALASRTDGVVGSSRLEWSKATVTVRLTVT